MREATEIVTETVETTTEMTEDTDIAGMGLLAVTEALDTPMEEMTSDMEGVRETPTPPHPLLLTTESNQ